MVVETYGEPGDMCLVPNRGIRFSISVIYTHVSFSTLKERGEYLRMIQPTQPQLDFATR